MATSVGSARRAESGSGAASTASTLEPLRGPSGSPEHPGGRARPVRFSLVLGGVLTSATMFGLLADEAYRVSPGVRADFAPTMQGQDLLTLLSVPVLVACAVLARRGSPRAHLVWLGLLLYYAYSYVMYAFSPFNSAFLLYVAALGLSAFGLLDGLLRLRMPVVAAAFDRAPRRPLAGFLVAVAVLFAVAWLAMLLPATFSGDLPAGRVTYDIPSAVHVLDLAFVLPLLAAAGVLLWRQHPAGPALAAVLLVKMTTLGLALLSMHAFVDDANRGEAVVWAIVAGVSVAWLVVAGRRARPVGSAWIRREMWPAFDDAGDRTTSDPR